jgi:PPOX class probable F420-dependent enzyme
MTTQETREFLLAGTRTGKLATVRKDGRPHVAPIWFVLDGDDVIFTTAATTAKGHALRRDPRATMCVDDQTPPFSYVVIEGTCTLSEDLDEMLVWATRLGARYMGEEKGDAFGRRNAVVGELLVRMSPTKTIARKEISA